LKKKKGVSREEEVVGVGARGFLPSIRTVQPIDGVLVLVEGVAKHIGCSGTTILSSH